jgi:hypothetical protein
MRARHADPEFKARNAERMRARHADPEFNPLASLTKEQRENYDVLVKKGGYTREEALAKIAERPTMAPKELKRAEMSYIPSLDLTRENLEVTD